MLKSGHVTALKIGAVVIAGYFVYSKVQAAKAAVVDVVTTSLNPMSRDNLAHIAAENMVGSERLASWGEIAFDFIDSVAEGLGSETGINGIVGTNAQAVENASRAAGSVSTAKFGANANG